MKYDKDQWLAFTCYVLNTYDPYYKQPTSLDIISLWRTIPIWCKS